MLYYRKDAFHAWQLVDVRVHKLHSVYDIKRFVAMFPSIEFSIRSR